MITKVPFQFSVLRYIHDSFTGEFLNVGVAFYSQEPAFFKARFLQKYSRLTGAFPDADGEFYKAYISRLQTKADDLCERVNSKQGTLMPWLPGRIEELLSQIITHDDSAIQFAPIQGGMTSDLEKTFEDIYHRLVEVHIPHEEKQFRGDGEIWSIFSKQFKARNVLNRLKPTIIQTSNENLEFGHAWRNGHWKLLEPISFDLLHAGNIKKKAFQCLGTNAVLDDADDVTKLFYLLGKPRSTDVTVQRAYDKAKDLLGTGRLSKKVTLIEEDEAHDFVRDISSEIEADTEEHENE